MSETTTTARLLRLLSLLQTPREWTGPELAGRLHVTPRTVRRDIDRLRELGYPVDASRGPLGGYRLAAGAAMPPLVLDDEEAVAVAAGLRTAAAFGLGESARRALAKIEQVLPSRLRHRAAAVQQAADVLAPPAAPVDAEAFAVLAAACRAGERIRFDYHPRAAAAAARRHAHPEALVAAGGHWYLAAYDLDRAAWRTFRLDRLAEPRPTGARGAPPEPLPAPDPAAYLMRVVSSPAARHRATALIAAPAAHVAARIPDDTGTVEPAGDGACRYRTGSDDLDHLVLRLAALGLPFTLEDGPPELRDRLRALGERLRNA